MASNPRPPPQLLDGIGSAEWPALRAARSLDAARRVPFVIDGQAVGSVARRHLQALQPFAPELHLDARGVTLTVPPPSAMPHWRTSTSDCASKD